jgi:hypothetical protein
MYAEIFGADSPFVIAHTIIIIKVFLRRARAVYHPQPKIVIIKYLSLAASR